MPSSAEHAAKAAANRAVLDSGFVGARPEWAAVVAFYAAVHLVERLAAAEPKGPIHHVTHLDRDNYLRAHRRHRTILTSYDALKEASLIGRYGTLHQFHKRYSSTAVQQTLIDTHLAAIEAYMAAAFAPPM